MAMTSTDRPTAPLDLSIEQLAVHLRNRDLSSVELTRLSIERAETSNPQLGAFITICAEAALKQAAASDRRLAEGDPRSALDGIPVALKDNIEMRGIRTTSNSRIFEHSVPRQDAEVVRRLKRAGAVIMGKTSLFEFGHGGPAWDLPWPPAINPWSASHLPGGSSSGSAAAVAARIVPLALGTDTGGSVRWPAAVCGISGLKPSYGVVSMEGIHPNAPSLDHCGPMARTAADCALALQAMAGAGRADPFTPRRRIPANLARIDPLPRPLRIGLVRHWYADDAHPDVTAAVDRASEVFEALGARMEPVTLAPLRDYQDCKTVISMSEIHAAYSHFLQSSPQEMGALMRERILPGSLIRAEDYLRALKWRRHLTHRMGMLLTSYDLLLTAGWLGTAEPNDPDGESTRAAQPLVTMPFSVTGVPAMAIPCGFSNAGLPVGMQIAGAHLSDRLVLSAAHAYQDATEWHLCKPPEGARL
ncbi:amidase [Nitratireductor luteus]|uniref:amidase n=1 Tax=Nitratireductor luteus TaxID=2976980 RepID=UPI00223FD424|nr:amidase [Nitratireductor luteus]